MMTPSVIKCLPWSDDSSRTPAEKLALLRTYKNVLTVELTSVIDVQRVSNWHFDCFDGFTPEECYAGNMRQVGAHPCLDKPNAVGYRDRAGIFIPLMIASEAKNVISDSVDLFRDVEDMCADLEQDWLDFSDGEKLQSILIIVSFAMGKFNKIHPFINGNGRITRLLMKWVLARFGFKTDVGVVARPSPSAEYSQAMQEASLGSSRGLMEYLRRRIVHI